MDGSSRCSRLCEHKCALFRLQFTVLKLLCTRLDYATIPRFGEFCSCRCLPHLPQLACSILAPYSQALYFNTLPLVTLTYRTPPAEDVGVIYGRFLCFCRRIPSIFGGGGASFSCSFSREKVGHSASPSSHPSPSLTILFLGEHQPLHGQSAALDLLLVISHVLLPVL